MDAARMRVGPAGDPLADLVCNSLCALAAESQQVIELLGESGVSPRLRRAARELAALVAADAPAAGTERVLEALAPLLAPQENPGDPAEQRVWGDLRRLAQDLSYVALLERGGISGINAQLDEWLGLLRTPHTTAAESAVLAGRLNDLLRRAIYLFAHLVDGLTLTVEWDDAAASTRIERYVGRRRANRRELLDLWQAAGNRREGAAMVIDLPLPYLFSGESAEARRRAHRESWEEVAFVPHRRVRRGDVRVTEAANLDKFSIELPPLVLVRTAFDRDLGLARAAMLLVREVRRIELARPTVFLPARSAKLDDDEPRPRLDPLTHYLIFRNFGDIGCNPRLARAVGIPQLADRSLFEPEYATGLLDVGDDEHGRQWLERGFGYLALLGTGHARAELLRFADVEVAYDEQTRRTAKNSPLQCALYRTALDAGDPLRGRARSFFGREIIRELLRIPVAPRHFVER